MGPHDPFASKTQPQTVDAEPLASAPGRASAPTHQLPGQGGADWTTPAWRGFGVGLGLGLLALFTTPAAAVGVAVAGLVGALIALAMAALSRELPRARRLLLSVLAEDAPDRAV